MQQKQKEPCDAVRKIPTGSLSAPRGLREALGGEIHHSSEKKVCPTPGSEWHLTPHNKTLSSLEWISRLTLTQLLLLGLVACCVVAERMITSKSSKMISVAGVRWATSSSEGNTLYPESHCCCFQMWWVTVMVTSLSSQTHVRCDVLVWWVTKKNKKLAQQDFVKLHKIYSTQKLYKKYWFKHAQSKVIVKVSLGLQISYWSPVAGFHLWVKSQLEEMLMAENSRRGSAAGCKGHLVETQGSLHDSVSTDQFAANKCLF